VQVARFSGVEDFLTRTGPFLKEREAEHNLILGICSTLREGNPYEGPPYLAAVEDRKGVAAAAIRTPPYNLVLSEAEDPRAVELFAADISEDPRAIPGAMGPVGVVDRFAQAWHQITGQALRETVRQRIFRTGGVSVPEGVPGRARKAVAADRDMLVRWIEAFGREALGDLPRQGPERQVERRLEGGEEAFWLWEDGQPVSLAGYGGRTPNGIRIGPVYTPPHVRGRGYAGALVGEVSRRLLEAGFRFCFLFTDLANPTSNRLYVRLGYRPVRDTAGYAFG
jgi:predicted GNAT family acetyltransferase